MWSHSGTPPIGTCRERCRDRVPGSLLYEESPSEARAVSTVPYPVILFATRRGSYAERFSLPVDGTALA